MDAWDLMQLDVEPHKPEVLRSDDGAARAIAIALPAGESLQEHGTYEHAWLHVHHGHVRIIQDGAHSEAAAGFLAHFAPHEAREIEALEDSRLLLLLAPWPGTGRDKDFNA
jgi:quercetin dioxygenase-like cupin family protein